MRGEQTRLYASLEIYARPCARDDLLHVAMRYMRFPCEAPLFKVPKRLTGAYLVDEDVDRIGSYLVATL